MRHSYINFKNYKNIGMTLLITLLLLLFTIPTFAATGGSFNLFWETFDGGSGQSSGGNYTLAGTIGQPDAGLMSSGSYTLTGGFWFTDGVAGGPGSDNNVYLPLIVK